MGNALVVGLGNPGKKYENTRHNLGFMIVRAFAEKRSWNFKNQRDLKGSIAIGSEGDVKVFLLLPTTYMNLSGQAVRKVIDFYKIELSNLIVLSDDIDLPFGSLRFRDRGSAGGHKGLKNIESHLGTQEYKRLRIGIGDREGGLLEDYVLAPFTLAEQEMLPEVIDRALTFLNQWMMKGNL